VQDPLAGVDGFDWDDGNIGKNWENHRVGDAECEEVFFNRPLIVRADQQHSRDEPRYYLLGKTESGRLLFGVFTIRGSLIRPISFRDMTSRERRAYENAKEDDSTIQN
jgi:uncharacterized DUF497 family protein